MGMGLINATLKSFRALKNANTGGRGISSVATKDFWINPEQVGRDAVESGRKLKNGINLRDLPNYQKGDKVIGSNRNTSGNVQHYVQQKDGTLKKYDIDSSGNAILSRSGKTVNSNLNWARNGKNYQNAPVRYDTDALTKKSYAIGLGVPALAYGGYKYLSSDSEDNNKSANVIANAAKLNNSQNTETASNTEGGSKNRFIKAVSGQLRTPEQEAKLQEIRERRAREADPERDLPYYAKSGQGQADPIQPPKAKTDVKPKTKSSSLNYDPMAEWAKTDQATNDKWLKRQADYKKLVSEGMDPYEAYDRSMQDQPAEPASATNTNIITTTKPAQNNNRLSYNPMFTDQAIELRRKQQGKN